MRRERRGLQSSPLFDGRIAFEAGRDQRGEWKPRLVGDQQEVTIPEDGVEFQLDRFLEEPRQEAQKA